jgi:hypothetical protein
MLQTAPTDLDFPLARVDAQHPLRALSRAAAVAVEDAVPDERRKAIADADAYDALRARLLTEVARRDCRGSESTESDPDEEEV